MSYTKRQFVTKAYEKIGLADYVFDLSPEQLQSACEELDALMADWAGKGIRIGWPFAMNPDNSNIDTDTGAPWQANLAIYTNLAITFASNIGKSVPGELLKSASSSYASVLRFAVKSNMVEMQYSSGTPMGAGNKWRGPNYPFVTIPVDKTLPPPEQDLTFSQ
jgi:hypothetical protein